MAFAFYNAKNLKSIPDGSLPDVLDFSYCFANCENLNLNSTFIFNQNPINVPYMFMNCGISGDLRFIPGLKFPASVREARGFFYGCDNITQLPYEILSDAIDIENLSNFCCSCTSLEEIRSDFIISYKTKNISRMFKNCINMTTNQMRILRFRYI